MITTSSDIVALQETTIDSSVKINELVPDTLGYDVYRKDRNGKGGGTMLLVKKYLQSAPFSKVDHVSESIWCYVNIQGKPYIHIPGDFNYPKIDWKTLQHKDNNSSLCDSEGQTLIDILNEASCEQIIKFPTRENNTLGLLITTYPGHFFKIH